MATDRSGLRFTHSSGPPILYLPQIKGPGCAVGDYDGDGWVDAFLPNTAPPPTRKPAPGTSGTSGNAGYGGRLFRNCGGGTFEDVTERAGIAQQGQGLGATWADVDGDGYLDLYVTGYGGCQLFHNDGSGTFQDATRAFGVAMPGRFSAGAAWADYDRDGWLDLYVMTYVDFRYPAADGMPSLTNWHGQEVPAPLTPPLYDGTPHALFHNEGGVRFLDVTSRAGVGDNDDHLGKGLGAGWTDVNDDGWPDLVLANDGVRKSLYINGGDGSFRSAARKMWLNDNFGSMGLCAGDVNGDRSIDLHFTSWFQEPCALYLNRHGAAFAETSDQAGLAARTRQLVKWGSDFLDYDNDGNLDLLVTCGSTFAARYNWATYLQDANLLEPQPVLLFRGDGAGHFTDVTDEAGLESLVMSGRGLAVADYDHDGAPDALLGVNNGPAALLHNRGPGASGWLTVELEGTRSNRSGIGARLSLEIDGRTQVREIYAGSSFLSGSACEAHFGLGAATGTAKLEVRWPIGARTTFAGVPINRRVRLIER